MAPGHRSAAAALITLAVLCSPVVPASAAEQRSVEKAARAELPDDPLQRALVLRARRIEFHKNIGIVAIPVLSWTLVDGFVQRALIDAGQPVPRPLVIEHRIAVMVTMTVHLMAGISALSMPRPRTPNGARMTGGSPLSRAHVVLSVIHTLGIVGVMVTGFLGRFATDEIGYRAATVAHVASGVVALAGLTASGVVLARF